MVQIEWIQYSVKRLVSTAATKAMSDNKITQSAEYKMPVNLWAKIGCLALSVDPKEKYVLCLTRPEIKFVSNLAKAKLVRLTTAVIPAYLDRLPNEPALQSYINKCKLTQELLKSVIELLDGYL